MKRVRAWLRAFGPLRLLDDCAALMVMESGDEAETDVRRALEARPPLAQRIALRLVLRAIRRRTARASLCPPRLEIVPNRPRQPEPAAGFDPVAESMETVSARAARSNRAAP